jgi:hypothetical protein
MQRLPPSSSVVGAVLVPALSTSDAVVTLAPSAVLVTSAVETASDSATDVSLVLLLNASWPEAFLPLSNVIGGALHMPKGPQSNKDI